MIQFPEGYFNDEVRSDFKVTSIMKACWAATLEVYREIREICDRHGLTVYAMFGTLIGAVRHQGFVPWDDDFDLAMPRADYVKFLEFAKEELPEGYYVDSAYSDEKYPGCFAKVFNCSEMNFDQKRIKKFHGFPFVVAIDLFAIDYAPNDEAIFQKQAYLLDVIRDASVLNITLDKEDNLAKLSKKQRKYYTKLRKEAERILAERLDFSYPAGLDGAKDKRKARELALLFDRVAAKNNHLENERCAIHELHLKRNDQVWPADVLEPVEVPFECITVTIPKGYDQILTTIYGDYMTPVQNTAGHNYPYFKAQIQLYIDYLEALNKSQQEAQNYSETK